MQHAVADRGAIFEHLESDSPRAAVKVDERIVAAVRRLLEFCVFCTALKGGRTISNPNKPNARLGRTPSLPCRPLYARYPAHSHRSANGRYPPNCDIACRVGRNGITRIRIFLKQLQSWKAYGS